MSKRKSADNSDGVLVQKPRSNVYTMMLILALISIITATVLLWLQMERYAPDYWKVKGVSHAASVERSDAPLALGYERWA